MHSSCYYPENPVPLTTETQPEGSCSLTPTASKENPLKRKRIDRLHEDAELMEMPKNQRKRETEDDHLKKRKLCAKRRKTNQCSVKSKNLLQDLPSSKTPSETPSYCPIMPLLDDCAHVHREPLPDDIPADFYQCYTLGEQIGRGAYGGVYAGVRNSDGVKVAVKYVTKALVDYYTPPGETRKLPLEAVLMDLIHKPYRSPYVIKMWEWFETPKGFLYVMERPHKYITLRNLRLQGRISEDMAKMIMSKVVQAVAHCWRSGVLHLDIGEDNILVHPDTLEVKLIDFNYALLVLDRQYKAFGGSPVSLPKTWIVHDDVQLSAPIADLGRLLYKMICGKMLGDTPRTTDGLSEACCNLINWCHQSDHQKRPNIEQILEHDWFRDKISVKRRGRGRRNM